MPKVALGSVVGTEQGHEMLEQPGHQIHRDQVHQVHQEDPDEDGQRQGRDHVVLAAEGPADVFLDEIDNPLHKVLCGAGLAGGDIVSHLLEEPEKQAAEEDGEEHGVHVDRPESHLRGLFGRVREAETMLGVAPEGEIRQMVLDVLLSGERFRRSHR